MTPLGEKIAARIRADGPISVADFMFACLADPDHGYYIRTEPFGPSGDFITAPEVSQMFGEIVGAWAVTVWQMMGSPSSFRLVELGPGRGTLMADVLRTARLRPRFLQAASLHLVETSARLREIQARAVAESGIEAHFHTRFADVPAGPAIVLANEFLDALPIRQLVRMPDHWAERVVGLDAAGGLSFGWRPLPAPPADTGSWIFSSVPVGALVEINLPARAIVGEVAGRIAANGGAALVIDYGHASPGFGDTLQAVSRHEFADVLERPGEADVTAHVDFAALTPVAANGGARVFPVVTQGQFLTALGLRERAGVLAARAKESGATIEAAANRLAGPDGMGTLFKVLVIAAPGLVPPPFDLTGSLPHLPGR